MNFSAAAVALALLAGASTQTAGGAFAPVENGKVWYQTCGSGAKTVVLVHDGLLDSAVWDGVWPALCARYRVIRYDRRGYGKSPEATQPYTPADDLAAVLQAAGATHATLIGSSSGGGLSVDFTLAHPEAVDRLVLIGPAIGGQTFPPEFNVHFAAVAEAQKRGDQPGAIKALSEVDYTILASHPAARKRAVAILTAAPQDMTHKDPQRPRHPALRRLSEIKAPTLILIGDHDAKENQDHAQEAQHGIPGARLVVMRDSGHVGYLEHPHAFAREFIAFIGR